MKRNTDEVCSACGSVVVDCDECDARFCPHEPAGHACRHEYEDDDLRSRTLRRIADGLSLPVGFLGA